MTIQPSCTTMKTATACEQALHLRDIEKSHSRVARGRTSGSKVRGKEVRAHSRVRLPLEMERFLPGITFLGGRARSLFGQQYTLGIPRENSSYLHTKKRLLWLYLSLFTHFNQPVTMTVNGLIKPGKSI